MTDIAITRRGLIRELRTIDARLRASDPPGSTDRSPSASYIPAVPPKTVQRLKGRCPICRGRLTSTPYVRPADVYVDPTRTRTVRDADLRVLTCAKGCRSRDIHAKASNWSPDAAPTQTGVAPKPVTTRTPPPTVTPRYTNPRLHKA